MTIHIDPSRGCVQLYDIYCFIPLSRYSQNSGIPVEKILNASIHFIVHTSVALRDRITKCVFTLHCFE